MLWPSSPHELYHVTLLIVHSRMALLRYSLTRMGLQIIILLAHIARAEDATKLSPTQKLIRHGFVVFDDVLSPADVASVRKSAEKLLENGRLRHLGQEGRDDFIVALAPGELQHDTDQYGTLVLAARVLMSLPSMLAQQGRNEGAEAEDQERFDQCTAPSKLMLARYPANAGRYVPHLDNDPDDPNHSVGPAGLRAIDRTFTCILYLNDDWKPEDEGYLRLHKPSSNGDVAVVVDATAGSSHEGLSEADEGGGWKDVEPKGGRLVIFDSRRMLHEVRPSYASRWAISAWLSSK